jgi:hypothetical protein
MRDTTINAAAERRVEWGNWALLFYWQVPGVYGPERIEGRLPFPVGARGPMDGCLGTVERQRYVDASKAWMDRGELPAGLYRRCEACGTEYRAERGECSCFDNGCQ